MESIKAYLIEIEERMVVTRGMEEWSKFDQRVLYHSYIGEKSSGILSHRSESIYNDNPWYNSKTRRKDFESFHRKEMVTI